MLTPLEYARLLDENQNNDQSDFSNDDYVSNSIDSTENWSEIDDDNEFHSFELFQPNNKLLNRNPLIPAEYAALLDNNSFQFNNYNDDDFIDDG